MSYGTAVKWSIAFAIAIGGSFGFAGDGPDVLRSLSDEARKRVYLLVPDGVEVLQAGTRRRIARVTLPGWIWADEPYSCPPDIALASEGDVLVTSNVVPVIWRIDPTTLATTRHELSLDQDRDKDVGFTRLRWSSDLRVFVAITDSGSRWHIDGSLSRARKVAAPRAGHSALSCESER
jgi:hypothetical protein